MRKEVLSIAIGLILMITASHGREGICAQEKAGAKPKPKAVLSEAEKGEAAWKRIQPSIELFWKQAEESPTLLAQAAWPVIRKLRRYIWRYPDSPHVAQAYYLIGEAYAQLSYYPEALAHWRIVAKLYPKSEWASAALMAILRYQEMTGKLGRMVPFYKKIVRQYPDTLGAKAAWIALAIDAVNRGNVQWIAKQTKKLERSYPKLYLRIPRLLDLKARIALAQGHSAKAEELWLHYLNLIDQPYQKAAALFHVGEVLKSRGRPLEARKYFALIIRDYPNSAEALFARFRLAQLKEEERRRLAQYVPAMEVVKPDPAAGRTMETILKRFPNHPLAPEVRLELARYRHMEMRWAFQHRDYRKVFRLGLTFASRFSNTPVAKGVKEQLLSLETQLLGSELPPKELLEFAHEGATFLQGQKKPPFEDVIGPMAAELWLEAMRRLARASRYEAALEEFWRYQRDFPHYQPARSRELGTSLLLGMDRTLMEKGKPLELVRYHYDHRGEIAHLSSPVHLAWIGRAWEMLNCPRAAERAYFAAWRLGGTAMGVDGMVRWAHLLVAEGEFWAARTIRSYITPPEITKTEALSIVLLDASLLEAKGKWEEVRHRLEPLIEKFKGDELMAAQRLLIKADLELGQWDQAGMVWSNLEPKLSTAEQLAILTRWSDHAMDLGFGQEALLAAEQLVSKSGGAPPYLWRVAKAKSFMGRKDAQDAWKALAAAKDPLWSKAAKAILANEEFWKGPASRFRSLTMPAQGGAASQGEGANE